MKKGHLILSFLVIFLTLQTSLLFAQTITLPTITPPWDWPITSDYGPRKVQEGSWFHEGIDYGGPNGANIPAVEGGRIAGIRKRSSRE